MATSLAGIRGKLEANEKGVDVGGGTMGVTTKVGSCLGRPKQEVTLG